LPSIDDPNYLNREQHYADAGVYRLDDETALVQSIDFFTPVVDDPYLFGQIAAANAFSDLYAMGAKPLTALNLVCFPAERQPLQLLEEILRGGFDKIREAGAVLIGGHSVDDAEPKYGLSVTGLVHPRRMITSGGARPGDLLFLTKPIGTGIITTALKGEQLGEAEAAEALQGMAALNAAAAAAMLEAGASAATDITGFGLLGHLHEMLINSGAGAAINKEDIPLYPRTRELAACGFVPGGAYRNLKHFEEAVNWTGAEEEKAEWLTILFDPQTSGGLLIAVSPQRAEALRAALSRGKAEGFQIGEITGDKAGEITIF